MLSMLLNKKFHSISRAADMLCLSLGDDYAFFSRGRQINAAEYSLHLQTQWRFRKGGTILLASEDIYEPYNKDVPENWAYDLVGRPDESGSVFDVCAGELEHMMRDAYVIDCRLSEANDITIVFSNDVIFEQFTPATTRDEEWRLIDFRNGVHLVCYDETGNLSKE